MIPATPSLPPVPPHLKDSLPFPLTPWNMSRVLFDRVRNQSTEKLRTCEVLTTDPDYNFILKFFYYRKPPNYGIKKVVCIHHPAQTYAFEDSIRKIDRDIESAPTAKLEDSQEERTKVIQRWKLWAEQFSPLRIQRGVYQDEFTRPKVVPAWYGCSKNECVEIATSGYSVNKNIQLLGNGIYFTNEAEAAVRFNSGGFLLLSWVAMREPYPVISKDIEKLKGKGAYLNYNAHFAPVSLLESMNGDILTVFQQSQALARFQVELGIEFSPSPEAVKKDPEAQFNLGLCLLNGTGVPKNPKEGIVLLLKAAHQKHAKAAFQLGLCRAKGVGLPKDSQDAVQWFKQAADQGLADAECKLGACYFKGIGVIQDKQEAIKWYKKAAAKNFPMAQYYLGSCLLQGEGVSQDSLEGVKLYMEAASKGIVPAQYHLGCLYLDGKKVTKDEKKGLDWLEKAAQNGDEDASILLKNLKKQVTESTLSPPKEPFLSFFKTTAQHVYENYLSKPYTLKIYPLDWELEYKGTIIQRPNHGLLNTLRCASYIPLVAELYNKTHNTQLSSQDIEDMQLTMLFYVAGRENDVSFHEDVESYTKFRITSAEAFEKYVKEKMPHRFTEKKLTFYKNGILNLYSLMNDPKYTVMRICHDLDLLRCYLEEEYEKKLKEIGDVIGFSSAKALSIRVKACLLKTGDRVLAEGIYYDGPLFISCSTNIATSLEKIHEALYI